jgi:hypothetical protein
MIENVDDHSRPVEMSARRCERAPTFTLPAASLSHLFFYCSLAAQ